MLKKYVKNPYRIFTSLASKGIFRWMGDKTYLKLMYRGILGKKLKINIPETFSEKIQWLKIYNRKKIYTDMVDKYEAKKYVSDKIGNKYITENFGVWDTFDEINFDELPDAFVLKTTHDSGGVLICKNKQNLDLDVAKKTIERSLARDYYSWGREWPYKNVKHRILAEKYMENGEEGLHDYKIWCFNGEPLYIQYITGRETQMIYERFYDRDWNPQKFTYHNPRLDSKVERPEKLNEMLNVAKKLAEGIPFLRVDLYLLNNGEIKFGELTFFPMSGFEHWHPESIEKQFGDLINISNV